MASEQLGSIRKIPRRFQKTKQTDTVTSTRRDANTFKFHFNLEIIVDRADKTARHDSGALHEERLIPKGINL